MLANAGVPVGNQAVILAGINDSVPIMKKLMHDLVKSVYVHTTFINVTYLKVSVTSVHQYLKVLKLLKVYVDTSGYAVPTFVVDAPGGGGKIALQPNYLISQSADKVVLRNFEGVITTYQNQRAIFQEERKDTLKRFIRTTKKTFRCWYRRSYER